MRHRPHLAILAAACLTSSLAPALSVAQSNVTQGQPAGLGRQARAEVLVSVNFTGGTLADYADALTQAARPNPANIILRGNAEQVFIGPATLEKASISSALMAVGGEYISGNERLLVTTQEFSSAQGYAGPDTDRGQPVYSVQVLESSRRSTGQPERREIIVLQIKELTTPLPGDPPESVVPAENVLTAIEAVLDISGNAEDTEIKYHAPSGLVMLAGPESALQSAQEVLHQLTRDVNNRRERARVLQDHQGLTNPEMLENDLADAQAKLEMAAVRMHVASERLELAERSTQEIQKQVEAGFASEGEMRNHNFQLIESQAEVEESRIEMQRQEQRVEQLHRALERSREITTGGNDSDQIVALREENTMLRDRLAMMEAQIAELRNARDAASGRSNQVGGGRAGESAGTSRRGGGGAR